MSDTQKTIIPISNDTALRLENLPLTEKSIVFFWKEQVYDPQNRYAYNDSVLVSRLDTVFLRIMSEPEKAVLAYIATFADSDNCKSSNECEKGVKCKIITALNLGCQCSNQHFDFLHKWFDSDAEVFKEGRCYQRHFGNTRRQMFSKINLSVKNNVLSVFYEGSGTNGQGGWSFKGSEIFQLNQNKLKVIDSKNTIFNRRKYED